GAVGDDVVELAVVGQDVDIQVPQIKVPDAGGQRSANGFLGLFDGHSGDVGGAINAQAYGAVGPNQVLTANWLIGDSLGGLNQQDIRRFDHIRWQGYLGALARHRSAQRRTGNDG